MNRRVWLIPFLIVAANALAILVQWNSLSETLPAHFDLQGNAAGSMPRSQLLQFPFIGVVICLVALLIARFKQRLQAGLVILASGICLVLFLSTMVTLTQGRMPIFMLAEPVVLLAAVVGCVVCAVKVRKRS